MIGTLTRRRDWKRQLWTTLDEAKDRPFEYGVHDCVTLTAQVLDAMLEEPRFVALVRGTYSTERDAQRLIAGDGLQELVTRELGPSVPRNLARQGDVCLADLERGPAVGICCGPNIAFAGLTGGLVYRELDAAIVSWRIGET
jgi:hypothetical protein